MGPSQVGHCLDPVSHGLSLFIYYYCFFYLLLLHVSFFVAFKRVLNIFCPDLYALGLRYSEAHAILNLGVPALKRPIPSTR